MTHASGLLVATSPIARTRPGSEFEPEAGERRKASRYPLHQDLRFRVLRREEKLAGVGQTLDFSSSGILFGRERNCVWEA